ncbi:MAG: putative metal-dependent HD superfamily phosphohydrolase [bacterium]|jgi:predicted metal-dependent HD superfamily phosphohydrolase
MNFELIEATRIFVKQKYDASSDQPLFYHNWQHTQDVCDSVQAIADNTAGLSSFNKELLTLAALFHDVAYTIGSTDHEKKGAEIATQYLSNHSYDSAKISEVARLILATQMGHIPADNLEEMIRDADMSHFVNPDYLSTTYRSLYREVKALCNPKLTQDEWASMCSLFLHEHKYHSTYAKEHYTPLKMENLNKIDDAIKSPTDDSLLFEEQSTKKKSSLKKDKKKKTKSDRPEKGVETMFRVALRNHMNLSRIADNKANTLIGVNGIIISIVLSTLFPKMDSNPFLVYPGLFLLIVSILTIILAIFSTIPKTTHGIITRKEVEDKKGNLIFFGNFHKMSLEDYEWGIDELMKDKDYLYKSLTRDLYFLGKVLNRKYTLLRWSYSIFVVGLVVAIALFVLSTQAITA